MGEAIEQVRDELKKTKDEIDQKRHEMELQRIENETKYEQQKASIQNEYEELRKRMRGWEEEKGAISASFSHERSYVQILHVCYSLVYLRSF